MNASLCSAVRQSVNGFFCYYDCAHVSSFKKLQGILKGELRNSTLRVKVSETRSFSGRRERHPSDFLGYVAK